MRLGASEPSSVATEPTFAARVASTIPPTSTSRRRDQRHGLAARSLDADLCGRRGEPPAQDPVQVREQDRRAADRLGEVPLPQLQHLGRHCGHDRGRAGLAGEERHLADDVASAELRDDPPVVREHVREAVLEHEQAVPRLARAADLLAGLERLRPAASVRARRARAGSRPANSGRAAEERERLHAALSACRSGLPDGSSGSSGTTWIAYGSL